MRTLAIVTTDANEAGANEAGGHFKTVRR